MSRLILHALAGELCHHRRTWGEPPDLLFAYNEDGEVGVRGLDLPAVVWMTGPTAQLLHQLAEAAELIAPVWRYTVPVGIIGIGLRCEGQYIDRDLSAVEIRLLGLGGAHCMQRATRGRFAFAVDRQGNTYSVETDPAGQVMGGRIVQPGDRDSAAVGSIPDALDRLLTAVLSASMPDRPYDFPFCQENREEPDK
jgi:hypothetical protein